MKIKFVFKKIFIFIILVSIIVFSVVCYLISRKNTETPVNTVIEDYLKSENLSHFENPHEPYTYTLDKTHIDANPKKWTCQNFDYNQYLGKKITEYYYEAHGIEYNGNKYDNVMYIFITCDNKLLGGLISFPTNEKEVWLNLDHELLE
jgi:hypothetical protein